MQSCKPKICRDKADWGWSLYVEWMILVFYLYSVSRISVVFFHSAMIRDLVILSLSFSSLWSHSLDCSNLGSCRRNETSRFGKLQNTIVLQVYQLLVFKVLQPSTSGIITCVCLLICLFITGIMFKWCCFTFVSVLLIITHSISIFQCPYTWYSDR